MSASKINVTPLVGPDDSELPAELNEYVALATWLLEVGLWSAIAQRLLLPRKRGYQGVDLVMVLLAYFCSGIGVEQGAVRGFVELLARRWGDVVASPAGRSAIPSQASFSRLAGCVSEPQAQTFGDWLLRESLSYAGLLRLESVQFFDRNGEGWHIFDADPTAVGIRQRALPEGDDLPQAERGSDALAAPGYLGRKRGEVKLNRPTVQHRGARIYVSVGLEPGNRDWLSTVVAAHLAVQEFAQHQGLEQGKCVVVIDGEEGGFSQLRAGLESGCRFLSRLASYDFLRREDLQDFLETADWQQVPDGRTGPTRFAVDIGTCPDTAGLRLVVSRFPADRKSGAGGLIGGHMYEVFATDLSDRALTAADIVALYYQRAGMENYFAVQNRCIDLEHVYSENPGGQLIACAVGLWLWNLQLTRGAALVDLPQEEERTHTRSANAPVPSGEARLQLPLLSTIAGTAEQSPPAPAEQQSFEIRLSPHGGSGVDDQQLQALLRSGSVKTAILEGGWDYDDDTARPKCGNGKLLGFHGTRPAPQADNVRIRYRANSRDCRRCPVRVQCTKSTAREYQRELELAVARPAGSTPVRSPSLVLSFDVPSTPSQPGPLPTRPPTLLPQRVRRAFQDLHRSCRIRITRDKAPSSEEPSPYFALSPNERQHIRKTWADRLAWNQLPQGDHVAIQISAPLAQLDRVHDLLGLAHRKPAPLAGLR